MSQNQSLEPRFRYPTGCPEHLVERLMGIAMDTATVVGMEARQRGLLLTNQMIEHIVVCLAAGLTVAAHDTLHRSGKLLADSEVMEWLKKHPVAPEFAPIVPEGNL